MLDYVAGVEPVCGKSWTGCTHIYIPVIANSHIIAVEIVFARSTMYVYDSDHGYLTMSQLGEALQLMAVIFPNMAKRAWIVVDDVLAIESITGTSKQSVSGDCGIKQSNILSS